VNPRTRQAHVANNGGNSVSVIDGLSLAVTATVDVGVSPVGVDVNTALNRVYVANSADDTVSVIQA
jgi:YVTN family beta-propeller protein